MWRQLFADRLREHARHTADLDWPFPGSRSLVPLLSLHSCRQRWSSIRRYGIEQAHTRLLPCSAAPTLNGPGSLYRTILKEETTKRQSVLFAFLTPMQSLSEYLLVRNKANKILLTFTLVCNGGH